MQIFAHRGASGYAPENTLAAMIKSIELGIFAIELDVHNVEGELYVFHDRRLDGKSTGTGLIEQVSQTYLDKVRVNGQPIPKLWDLLVYLQEYKPIINIELKGMNSLEAFISLYPKLLTQLHYQPEQLLISSFNHVFIQSVKQHFPYALVAPLIEGIPYNGAILASQLQAYSLHLSLSFLTQEIIDDAHRRGIKVYVYTVDNPQDITMLYSMGIDGIFSNYPDKSRQLINQLNHL